MIQHFSCSKEQLKTIKLVLGIQEHVCSCSNRSTPGYYHRVLYLIYGRWAALSQFSITLTQAVANHRRKGWSLPCGNSNWTFRRNLMGWNSQYTKSCIDVWNGNRQPLGDIWTPWDCFKGRPNLATPSNIVSLLAEDYVHLVTEDRIYIAQYGCFIRLLMDSSFIFYIV